MDNFVDDMMDALWEGLATMILMWVGLMKAIIYWASNRE